MNNFLEELLSITEQLKEKLSTVHSNLKNNNPEQVELILELVENRQVIIDQLEETKKQPDFKWTEEDRIIFTRLQELDENIGPIMIKLFQSFQTQITRINQTKQVSKKYIGAYQNMMTDGSFIDKRK